MKNNIKQLEELEIKFDEIIKQLYKFEEKYEREINEVNPLYKASAKNLIQYLASSEFSNPQLEQ